MEQINTGVLELLKHVASSQMNSGKVDPNGGESEFGKLLEEKSIQSKPESVTNQKETTSDAVEKQEEKTPVDEKAETDNKEEEICDVAREAACAQIVWLMPQTTETQSAEQVLTVGEVTTEAVATVTGEMPVVTDETAEAVLANGEMPVVQENAVAETTEQNAEVQLPTAEANVEVTEIEAPEMEIRSESGESAQANVDAAEEGTDAAKVEAKVTERIVADDTESDEEIVVTEEPVFKNVEAAPIKVAEAPARTAEAEPVETQVIRKLEEAFDAGETRVEIRLEPVALGKVTVELKQNADGTMSILLNAESAQTRGLLEKNIGSLQEALAQRGQQNVQITVERGEESARQDGQQNDLRDSENRQQPQQQRRDRERSSEDFLQQLRLGLIPEEDLT